MSKAKINVILFGEFSLSYKGKQLAEKDYRSQKMWAVLAYLIMNRHRPVAQSELIQRFWDEEEGQNPANALKTLIFRLRKLLLPLLGEQIQPIISTLGAYQWSRELPCTLDVEEFESLLHKCKSEQISSDERLECYRQALALYRGDFLPKAVNLSWHTMRSAYYHMQYSEAACAFAELLQARGEYEEMMHVCGSTLHQGILEEKLYIMLIRGLLYQGNHTQALHQFENATDVLYHELGVSRSDAMDSLYREIMDESMTVEQDVSTVLEDMRDDREAGAFFCEYGFFKEAYRLEARRAAKSGIHSHVALMTLVPAEGKTLSKEVQNKAMKALQTVLCAGLRETDVVARYSARQYVLLLPMTDYEESADICRSLEKSFHHNWYHRIAGVNYAVRPVEHAGSKGV